MAQQLRFVVIEVHTSPWEAHVSRALIESEGIPAYLGSEHHIWLNWPMSLTLGGVRLLVPVEHEAHARQVLAMRDRGELEAALLEQSGSQIKPVCVRCGSTGFKEVRDGLSVFLSFALLLICRVIFPPLKEQKCVSCGARANGGL